MNEELELTNIDRKSPIWGGSGCDYFSLEAEVNSYWTQFYKNQLNITDDLLYLIPTGKEDIEWHNSLVKQLEDGVFGNTQLKTEEYFRELWRDVKKVGFEKEDSDHCIDTCDTLIREEVEWWEERTDLRKYKASKIPLLVEYHSWDVIWRLCKYEKLVAHPLHNYASKRQSILKRELPENTSKRSISLNLETMQFAELCEGFKRIGAIGNDVSLNVFKSYLNGSEVNSIITPIKFKNNSYTSVFIYLCEEYGLQAQKEYFKWKEFFGIEPNYAKKNVSSYRNNHLGIPPYYNQMKDILEEIGCKKPK
jgi:hypothetical protein